MYGIRQRARDGGGVMYRMYGIRQKARDGGGVIAIFVCFTPVKTPQPCPILGYNEHK